MASIFLVQYYQYDNVNRLAAVMACFVIVLSGCSSAVHTETTDSTDPCGGVDSMTHPGQNTSIAEQLWDRDSVIVGGFDLPADSDVLFVVYRNDTVLGVRSFGTADRIGVDGIEILLDGSLTGQQKIQTILYADTDHDGRFDPDIDTPCQDADGVVTASPQQINFTSFT
ncbi:MAG: hypothetical protein ACOCQY_01075 [Halorhabdus sp.]